MKKLFSYAVVVAALGGTVASPAEAQTTLGSTTRPASSTVNPCNPMAVMAQVTDPPGTPYRAPGTGTITQWRMNSLSSNAGRPVQFIVFRPAGGGSFSVTGIDSRNLPNPVTPNADVTFVIANPIEVIAGDIIGLSGAGDVSCFWNGGFTSPASSLGVYTSPGPPAPGQTLTLFGAGGGGFGLNLAATFVPAPVAAPTPTVSTPTPPVKRKCRKKPKKSAGAAKRCGKKKRK